MLNENSGVWTSLTTNAVVWIGPRDHPRTYSFLARQLMHVSVQKFTSTTRPRCSAGPSGSELSHPVAPSRGHVDALEDAIYRSSRNAARISVEKSSGSSQAAKWPPLSTSLK